MKKYIFIIIVIYFCVQPETLFAQFKVEALVDTLEEHIGKYKYPGLMLSIVRADTILFSGGIGYSDIDKKIEVTAKDLFRQGSISKSFTALALLKVMKEHQLNLDSPILEIDPDVPISNAWSEETPITIAHLLEHTTGFDGWHTHAIYNFTDSITPTTEAMVHSHQKSLKSRWKPGTIHAYNNPGYVVAGHLIETLSKTPYHEYIRKEILEPIGMHHSDFYFKKPKGLYTAKGYEYKNGAYQEVPFVQIQAGPAGELCSSAQDMSKYLQFMLKRKGSLIDSLVFTDAMFDRIENSKTTLSSKNGLEGGYGLGNFNVIQRGILFHGHDGGIDGFSSRYIYSLEANIGIAISTNTIKDVTPIMEFILDFFFGTEESIIVEREEKKLPAEQAHQYEGFYVFKDDRLILRGPIMQFVNNFYIDYEGGRLYVKDILGGIRGELTYAGGNKFYRNDDTKARVAFFDNDEGKKAIGITRKYAEKESYLLYVGINFLVLLSMFLCIVYLVQFGIWCLWQLYKKKTLGVQSRWVLFIACLSFPIMFLSFVMALSDRITSGSLTFFSGLLYVSSLTMLIFTIVSIRQNFKLKGKKSFRIFYGFSTAAIGVLTIFFFYHGFLGIKLWSY